MSDELKQHEKPLSVREKIACHVLLLVLKIVKSSDFYAEEEVKKIREYLAIN